MRTIAGTGAWPGRAEGPVVWLRRERAVTEAVVADRAAEVLRFRSELRRALGDLEAWSEQQQTVEGRLLLQGYRDALLEDAWGHRVCALIDSEALCAPAAAIKVAAQVSGVMARAGSLQERADHLRAVGRWLADRLDPLSLPADAILAANRLSPLAAIDRTHPAVTGGPEPPVLGAAPLVWGLREIGPHWQGKRMAIDGRRVHLRRGE
jgi:phosphoenolpyruvate-protein kinase (PTS system EI component)